MHDEAEILQQRIEVVAVGQSRDVARKGLEVNSVNARKPTAMMPMTASTRAMNGAGRSRESAATATVQRLSTSTQSSSEPSCAPTPRKTVVDGSLRLEFWAT